MSEPARLPISYAVSAMALALTIASMVWLAAFLVPLPTTTVLSSPGAVATTSIALACLLTLVLMVEAVAHERLFTDAFDPLAQRESARLKVNLRVLQNTLEQLPSFAAGIAMIVWLFPFESAFRGTLAATVVWVLSRWAFWVGYHLGSQHRIAGMVGVMQSMVILLATFAVLGWRLGGWPGASLVPSLFSIGELIIIAGLLRRR